MTDTKTDALDWSAVRILNSANVSSWPITSEITELGILPGTLHLVHAMSGVWRPVPFETAQQEATFWVFLRIGGQWYATGAERIRPNQRDKPEGAVAGFIANWLYDANRWGAMTNYQPKPGELVGVMVAAGDTRGAGVVDAQERTPVYLIKWPGPEGARFPPFVTNIEESVPDAPSKLPPNPFVDGDIERLLDSCDRMIDGLEKVNNAVGQLNARLDYFKEQGIRVMWR